MHAFKGAENANRKILGGPMCKETNTGFRFEVRNHNTRRLEVEHEERDRALAEQLVASAPRALVGAHTQAGGG